MLCNLLRHPRGKRNDLGVSLALSLVSSLASIFRSVRRKKQGVRMVEAFYPKGRGEVQVST